TARRRRKEGRLTVAVDISSFWEPLTGIGWYLYRLLENLADHEDVLLRLYGPTLLRGEGDPEPVVSLPRGRAIEEVAYEVPEGLSLPTGWVRRALRKARPLLVAADGNRVVFAPNYLVPGTFRLCRGALVATVHDLGYLKVPETLQEETLDQLRRGMKRTFRQVRQVVTPSHAVAREIVEAGLAPAERVTAVHHGPGQLVQTSPGQISQEVPRPFALFVGTVEPRKNLPVVLEAWHRLREAGRPIPPLVVCGKLGWKSELIASELDAARGQGWLHHLGYVGNPTLKALYREAWVVVFPSLYEGFGLPAVEAQEAGAPLLCSDIPVFREVVGEAALFASPQAPQAWCEQLCRLLDNPELSRELAARGQESVARLSWQRAAAETLQVWQKAAGLGGRDPLTHGFVEDGGCSRGDVEGSDAAPHG
ncbi:MAG: glycosyltransferase family 4 protein, partial [Acidobacteria bacterium]|nr:glycosyltransferase family 4 protein [Acidobacteriota bacterium]